MSITRHVPGLLLVGLLSLGTLADAADRRLDSFADPSAVAPSLRIEHSTDPNRFTVVVTPPEGLLRVASVVVTLDGDIVAGRVQPPWSFPLEVDGWPVEVGAQVTDRRGVSVRGRLVVNAPVPCVDDDDCDASELCARAVGDCDGDGTCLTRPEVCFALWDPVCGCDGETYPNHCEAARAGVSVAAPGACETDGGPGDPEEGAPCHSSAECEPDELCDRDVGDCDGEGSCVPRPEVCTADWQPVCGCDGVTYSNACEAARAGVSVADDGPC